METTVEVYFDKDNVKSYLLNDTYVSDVLLSKAWYLSELPQLGLLHTKQRIIKNEVEFNKTYRAVIKRIDCRKIKDYQQYIYEVIYYDGFHKKAEILSTFIEEVYDAISN